MSVRGLVIKSFGLVFNRYTIHLLQCSARQHVEGLLQKYFPVNMDTTEKPSLMMFLLWLIYIL